MVTAITGQFLQVALGQEGVNTSSNEGGTKISCMGD